MNRDKESLRRLFDQAIGNLGDGTCAKVIREMKAKNFPPVEIADWIISPYMRIEWTEDPWPPSDQGEPIIVDAKTTSG